MNKFLNQTAKLYSNSGWDAYGNPKPDSVKDIKVRWQESRRLILDKEGREIISEIKVFTLANVKVDDVLEFDGKKHIVLASSKKFTLQGEVSHLEVAL